LPETPSQTILSLLQFINPRDFHNFTNPNEEKEAFLHKHNSPRHNDTDDAVHDAERAEKQSSKRSSIKTDNPLASYKRLKPAPVEKDKESATLSLPFITIYC
jgi:hypothetical protein